jgi:hypothetical protein
MTAIAPQPAPVPRGEMLELYKLSIDEYRFQAQFNWSRTQYWLAFNTGILAAGIALLGTLERALPSAIIFLVGVIAAALSARAVHVAHDYYRATRDRLRRLEDLLDLPTTVRFDTTAQLKAGRSRSINVTMVSYLLLGAVGVADVVGIVAAFLD